MIVVPIYDMIILPGVTFYFKQDVFQELEIEDVKEGGFLSNWCRRKSGRD